MVDAIIILIVIVILCFAIKGSLKHFRGEGSCCGGGGGNTIKSEKTLADPIIKMKDVKIDGMTCSNCESRVQNELNKINGLKADVSYKKKVAHLSYSKEIDDEVIKRAVEKAGYKVV